MNNISQYSNCYGCSVCQQVCPRNIIEIVENNSGFYQPQISKSDDENEIKQIKDKMKITLNYNLKGLRKAGISREERKIYK